MRVLRQADSLESGRVNQKRRTRAALVDAAKRLLEDGVTPTVAQAAEAALVSRTTAYRYFPTQDALLLEISIHDDVDEIEALVHEPLEPGEVGARLLEVLDMLNRHVLADEVRYRTMLRFYLDQWLASTAAGEAEPVVREGRRRRWIDTTLEPWRGRVPEPDLQRLRVALSLVTGIEAIVALRDTARVPDDEALHVAAWVADIIIRAVLAEHPDATG